ncbi:MAG: hypothetical protein QOJ98_786 [Acidobacteriota bacterium]|jgi:hypothetical protein|nr:hypothetical protein [Acidobacteriota bacterium]
MEYVRDNENVSLPMPRPPIDVTPFVGTWRNTNETPYWTSGVRIAPLEGSLLIEVSGGTNGSPDQWGPTRATHLYGSSLESATCGAWRASYDLGFCDVDLEANINQGLMVVVQLVRMKDGSGRSDRAVREFFYQG